MFANSARIVCTLVAVFIALSVLLTGGAAWCQLDSDPANTISLQNSYLGVSIGMYGKWKLPSPPYGHWLLGGEDQPVGGRFQLYTTGGDPTNPQDDNQLLNYAPFSGMPGDKWGAFQLMVDGTTTATGGTASTTEPAWATFDRGGTSAIMGDLKDGAWSLYPYTPTNQPNVILGEWYPNIKNGIGITTGDGTITPFPIRCEMEVRLLRDTVRFKWKITNQDIREHLIGLRCYADVMPSPVDDGTRDLRNIVSIPGYPLIENRSVMLGKNIPSVLEMFNSQQDPLMSIRFTLKNQGATPPDVIGIDNWGAMASPDWTYWFGNAAGSDAMTTWDCFPTPNQYIEDLGYGAFWKPRRVAAGASITYISYMGLGCATSDFTKPNMEFPQYVAAAQSTRALKYTNDVTGAGELFPAPFNVHAWLMNTEKYTDFQNASFSLILPTGLKLDDSEVGRYSKSVSDILAGNEAHVSWKVTTDPANPRTGILDYSVSVSASPVGGTIIRRQINIPATEVQPLSSGWQMISVPFDLTDSSPSALGLTNEVLWKYNPSSTAYESVTQLVPGEGYWLKLGSAQTTAMTVGNFSPKSWTGTQGQQIPLQSGWNLVGNPYLYAFTLGEAKFYHRDYGTMTYDEAISRGLINSTLFWWDPVFRQYRWSSDRSVQIKPWQGYWMRVARSGVTMTVSPASQIGAAIGGSPTSEDTGSDTGGGGGVVPPPGP